MAKNLEFKGKNVEIVNTHPFGILLDQILFQNKKKAADQIIKLYKLFCKLDCTQLEINPFGLNFF